jgi:hypothetical protein
MARKCAGGVDYLVRIVSIVKTHKVRKNLLSVVVGELFTNAKQANVVQLCYGPGMSQALPGQAAGQKDDLSLLGVGRKSHSADSLAAA